MGATFSRTKTWSAGDILTAADQNAEFDNILNNLTTAGMDDYSANVTEMRATTDPYPSGAESLATSLQGEITRLRYVIKQITGEAQWMIDPDTDLSTLQAARGAANGIATLNSSSKVVEDPANATATPTASKIPIADGGGKLDGWVTVALTKYFESTEQTITAGGALTLAHGLGAEPKLIQVFIKCTTAEGNYSIGDKVAWFFSIATGTGGYGVVIIPDSTNLNVRFGSAASTFTILNKTTGAQFGITNANWTAIFRAWL